MRSSNLRPASGEFLGAAGLGLAVMGGIHFSAKLGDSPAAPLIGVVAIAAAIAVILAALGPLTGGHLNPAISLSLLVSRHIDGRRFMTYAASQLLGAVLGMALGNWAWSVDLVSLGSGGVSWRMCVADSIATFGLIAIIHGCVRGGNASRLWLVVPGYVIAVGFAAPFWVINPALVVALAVTGGGWSSSGALALIECEALAAIAAALCVSRLYGPQPSADEADSSPEAAPETKTVAEEPQPSQSPLGTAVYELMFDAPPQQREAVAAVVLWVADRIHRPIDFVVRDPAGRLLLAVDAADEQALSSILRRLNDHVALALIASGLPATTIALRPVDRAALALR